MKYLEHYSDCVVEKKLFTFRYSKEMNGVRKQRRAGPHPLRVLRWGNPLHIRNNFYSF